MARGGDELAVGQHHLHAEQVVDRQPALPRQVADAAAQRETADAGGRDDAGRDGQAEGVRRVIDVAPQRAAAGEHRLLLRIDAHVSHRRQIDHQPVVADAEAAGVVAAAADRDEQLVARGRSSPR